MPRPDARGLLLPDGAAGSPREAQRTVRRPGSGCQGVRERGVPSALSSNWVFALCPSFSSSSAAAPPPHNRAPFRGGLSTRLWGGRAWPRRAAGGR